ncbi:MAG TPA: DUF342 domain-containing protein [Firmicutes bacterium]|nr:DUF342 domain-containing protein [Bacillota bacterium]
MTLEKDSVQKEQQCLVQVSSGAVEISGPAEESEGVILTPGEGVTLWVNGRQVKSSCRVYPQDELKVEGVHRREPAQVKVNIVSDQMSAEAIYHPPRNIRYVIPDYPPAAKLTINASKEEQTTGPDLNPGEIKNILESSEAVHGLKESALLELIEQAGTWKVVATGTPPVQGENGRVEFLFKEGLQQVSYNQQQAQVDYKKRYEIPQVNEGQVIAKIHPPRPGQPGMTVTGKEIPPAPVQPAEVRCETGTSLSADQTEVIAARKGVPFCRRGRQVLLRVDDIYHHRGDIDIKSGHTSFTGHLKITGGIEEGMRVKADGDIEIAGHTSGADITAGGSIIINRNCIKCQVQAGWLTFQLKKINQVYEDLIEKTGLLINMGQELINVLQERGSYTDLQVSFLMRSLIQKKFPELPRLSAQALKLSRELARELPDPLKEAVEICDQYLQSSGFLLTWPQLQEIHEGLCKHQELLKFSDPETAGISAYYVQNSSLTCPGDIQVSGPGAYNSAFECGGQVQVIRIFRGGSIKAGGNIYIGEAGIPRLAEIQGVIETTSGQVYIDKIYENTRIKIGKLEICLQRNLSEVRFYLDEQGDIKIGRWGK